MTYRSLSDDGCMALVAEVLSQVRRNPFYALDPCCRWWCSLVGLDPQALWERAIRDTRLEGLPYAPHDDCRDKLKILQVSEEEIDETASSDLSNHG